MPPPIDIRDPVYTRSPSQGRSYLYVFPSAVEDLLKLGFSRDPLDRLQTLHARYYEIFDLESGFLVEVDAVREARALERQLGNGLAGNRAAAPLTVRAQAGGHTEWYRGAGLAMADASRVLEAQGHLVHRPLRPWLSTALGGRRDLLFSWTEAMLSIDDLESGVATTAIQRGVRDALDAFRWFGIDIDTAIPPMVLRWHRAVSGVRGAD